ncbi:MAG: ABC transporter permease subunit [Acidobacteriia bacterium]|nr:ABC transporter permease subunit [Terriglobia bacterium]
MKPAAVFTMWRKEMLEMVRDRRTLISMVVAPILAIPVLLGVVNFFTSSGQKQAEQEAMTVAVGGPLAMPGLEQALAAAGFKLTHAADPRAAVEQKKAAAAVVEARSEKGEPVVRLLVDASRQGSRVSADKLAVVLDGVKSRMVREALAGSGVPAGVLQPFSVERVDVAPRGKMAKTVMGGVIGYIVILLMFSGCMYPAIDMTAGEKERRTLEILLSSPAGRNEIVLGKILAASTASFLTALLNVLSLAYSFRSGLMGPEATRLLAVVKLDPKTVSLVLVAVAPTAITAAAVMITISLFAKSFKEGQSYLTPLIMLVVFPAIMGMLPGVEGDPRLMMLPVFNVSQLIKSIFNGEYTAASFLLPFASNLFYAGVAFFFAVRIFKREDVLFRS